MAGPRDRMLTFVFVCCVCKAGQAGAAEAQWTSYGGSSANYKYSSASQISRENVQRLSIAWKWRSPDEEKKTEAKVRPWLFEVTPLMVDGKLFVSTGMGIIAAIDPANGTTLWTFDPES